MSATTGWAVPARAFEANLEALKHWRQSTAEALAAFRRWAVVGRLVDEQEAARLAHLERRLSLERLTVAVVGEAAAGSADLVNAIFFGEGGARVVPPTSRCTTEIQWDPARPASLRLLPITTREGSALRDCFEDASLWTEVALDPAKPADVAAACEALAETIEVDAATAAEWGAIADGSPQVPRWRYAVVNLPHALLASGISVLHLPEAAALDAEPELAFHRLPDAAAVVFTVTAEAGVTQRALRVWGERIAPVGGIEHTCFVVLNRTAADESDLAEIDRRTRAASEALGAEPTRVFWLSAAQAFAAKATGDRDALLRSRLYRLEQALARGIGHQRRLDHATAVRAEAHGVFAETRALIESRLAFTTDQVAELLALQDRNQQLVQKLAKKAGVDRGRIELAKGALSGLRASHNRNGDELAKLLDPGSAAQLAEQARDSVAATRFSKDLGGAAERFFTEARERLQRAISVIDQEKLLMKTAAQKFTQEYQIALLEVADFGTQRFLTELERLEQQWAGELKGRTSMLLRSGKALGAQFFEGVGLAVVHVFEIADRETKTWMQGFLKPLEAQVTAYQEQSNARIEGMARIQNAETDLIERLEELRTLVTAMQSQRDEWQSHHDRLTALVEPQPRPSLA